MNHLNLQEVTIGPISGRAWTKIYSTLSLVFVRQNHDPFGRTRGHCLTIFLREIGRKYVQDDPRSTLDYITTLLGVQEATIFFRDGMEGHEETILHFSISWLFTSFCICRNMLFTQRCATRFAYALLTDQKVILSFSPLHRSRQTRKTCQLCKENLSVMQGSLQNWSIYELCQSYARN